MASSYSGISSEETALGRYGVQVTTLRTLSKTNLLASFKAIGWIWVPVIASALACERLEFPGLYLLTICVIASRQHACMILMHEGTHFRLARSRRLNDILSDAFAALPIFMNTEVYRRNHLRHHAYLCTPADPDWVRKVGQKEWTFPKTASQLFGLWSRYLWGAGLGEMFQMWRHLLGLTRRQLSDRTLRTRLFLSLIYYLGVIAALSFLQAWTYFFWYWALPSLTLLPLIMRLRSIAEHFALSYRDELSTSRNVLCGPLEQFFISPFHVNYHLDHHLFPSVPYHQLPALHLELERNGTYQKKAHNSTSYLGLFGKSLLTDMLGKGESPNLEKGTGNLSADGMFQKPYEAMST